MAFRLLLHLIVARRSKYKKQTYQKRLSPIFDEIKQKPSLIHKIVTQYLCFLCIFQVNIDYSYLAELYNTIRIYVNTLLHVIKYSRNIKEVKVRNISEESLETTGSKIIENHYEKAVAETFRFLRTLLNYLQGCNVESNYQITQQMAGLP